MSGTENLIDAVNIPCWFSSIHAVRGYGRMCLASLSPQLFTHVLRHDVLLINKNTVFCVCVCVIKCVRRDRWCGPSLTVATTEWHMVRRPGVGPKGPATASARVRGYPSACRAFGVVSDGGRMRAATVANPIGHVALPTCPAPLIITVLIV